MSAGSRALVLAALAATALGAPASTATAAPGGGTGGVKLKGIGRFQAPVHVTTAPGAAGLYVVEQAGRVRVLVNGRKRGRPFLDIRGLVRSGGEEGLLSIAFHPGYGANRLLYAYYTDNAGDNVVAEFRRAPGNRFRALRSSRRTVLRIHHPGQSNHNGGQIAFGPGGALFIGPGDGGGGGDPDNSAQRIDSLLGKLLRIDPRRSGGRRYSIPAGNPFVGRPGRDEIYARGLRNPFRFSFDRTRKRPRIAIGDVGQDRFEEINYETVGGARNANFGWNDFEGFKRYPGGAPPVASRHDRPIFTYGRSRGCTVIAGFVVRDRGLRRLRGRFVYGDFCTGQIRSFVPSLRRAKRDRKTGVRVTALSSFGEGKGGAIYATSLNGPVYRLMPTKR